MNCPRCHQVITPSASVCSACGFIISARSRSSARMPYSQPSLPSLSEESEGMPSFQLPLHEESEAASYSAPPSAVQGDFLVPPHRRFSRPTRFVASKTPEAKPPSISSEKNRIANPASQSLLLQSRSQSFPSQPLAQARSVVNVGDHLNHNRYRLIERQYSYSWAEASETRWKGVDLQQNAAPVTLCEVVFPTMNVVEQQLVLRAAIHTTRLAGSNPHVPELVELFREHGHDFFVFEQQQGEILATRMRREGGSLSEVDAINGAVQCIELLSIFTQQTPPLFHGFISPETITIQGTNWQLPHCSILLNSSCIQHDSAATQQIADRAALMQTIVYALSGRMLTPDAYGNFPPIRQFNTNCLEPVSEFFTTLHTYSNLAELRTALRHLHNLTWQHSQSMRDAHQPAPASYARKELAYTPEGGNSQLAQVFADIGSPAPERVRKSLLSHPETLPPIPEGRDDLAAYVGIAGLLAVFVLPVLLK